MISDTVIILYLCINQLGLREREGGRERGREEREGERKGWEGGRDGIYLLHALLAVLSVGLFLEVTEI